MKIKILTLTCALTFSSSLMANGSCDTQTRKCSPSSPFDVTNANFKSVAQSKTAPPDIFFNPFNCRVANYCFGSQTFINGNMLSLLQGMAGYAEEYEEWYDAAEWYYDLQYVWGLNEDLTDNIAWGLVNRDNYVKIELPDENISRTYGPGIIISGADWDNNGMIDSLEVVDNISHYNGRISIPLEYQ